MALVVTMSFDDEDPDVHAHFTAYAQSLDDTNPREMARVLHTLEEALHAYAVRVFRSRTALEARMAKPAEPAQPQEPPRGQ
jgi:hypothetical protein